MLCDRYVYLIMFDAETGKFVQFKSHDKFDLNAVGELISSKPNSKAIEELIKTNKVKE